MPVETGFKRDAIFWHYPHYHPGGATPYSAVRAGNFRLIQFYEDGHLKLYNLAYDISERTNLVAQMPEKPKALAAKLQAWRNSVGAQMPASNPDWDGK